VAIRSQSAKLDIFTKIAIFVLVVILSVLILIPVGNVLYKSFQPGGIDVLQNVVDNDYTRQIILNTIWLGTSVGAVGTMVGFLLAYVQVRINFRGKKITTCIESTSPRISTIRFCYCSDSSLRSLRDNLKWHI